MTESTAARTDAASEACYPLSGAREEAPVTESAIVTSDAADEAALSLTDAIRMQHALIRGYMAKGFQQGLWQAYKLEVKGRSKEVESEWRWMKMQRAMAQVVQFPVLQHFGFEPSPDGINASRRAFTPALRASPKVQENMELLMYLLDPRRQLAARQGRERAPRGVPRSRLYSPDPETWGTESNGNVWIVAGGGYTGGITVRKTADMNSSPLSAKLRTNSLVEELQRQNHRIKYSLIEGAGPDFGWVSISAAGEPLLVPAFPALDEKVLDEEVALAGKNEVRKVTLTVDSALRLQHALIRGFMARDFQERLWSEYESIHGGVDYEGPEVEWKWVRAQRDAAQRVQFSIIPRFGFKPLPSGVVASKLAFTPAIRADPRVAENKKLLKYLLEPRFQLAVKVGKLPAPRGALRSRSNSPHPSTWMKSNARLWTVASGSSAAGAFVFKTASTVSAPLRAWLAMGSLVEELEMQDNWIKYLLLEGSGPDTGWVNISISGEPQLAPALSDADDEAVHEEHLRAIGDALTQQADPEPTVRFAPPGSDEVPVTETAIVRADGEAVLTVNDAVRLQHALIRGFMAADFQKLLWATHASYRHTTDSDHEMQWIQAQRAVAQAVQFPVIRQFGFEPSPDGVSAARAAIGNLVYADSRVAENKKLTAYLVDPRYQLAVQRGRLPAPRGVPWSRLHSPNPDDWLMESNCKVWRVVGGKDASGILVRKTAGMDTIPFAINLATGSWVEELERRGRKIKYHLMEGSGPHTGWVSVSTGKKPLLVPAFWDASEEAVDEERFKVVVRSAVQRSDPDLTSQMLGVKEKGATVRGSVVQCDGAEWLQVRSGSVGLCFMLIDGKSIGLGTLLKRLPPLQDPAPAMLETKKTLALEEILMIQHRLIRKYMSEDFQSTIWEEYQRSGTDASKWSKARDQVDAAAQCPIIREFGFAGTPEGVLACANAVPDELQNDPRILENRRIMEYLLEPRIQEEVMIGKRKAPRGVPMAWRTCPNPDQRWEPIGMVWVVVGGDGSAGAVVRAGRDKDSSEFASRLSPGSMVEEKERDRNRMKYLLTDGEGPSMGWVSISTAGRPLLVPAFSDLGTWVVVNDRVAKRAEPQTSAGIVGLLKRGATVKGSVVEQGKWLEVVGHDGLSYMLIDGSSIGLGTLLQPVGDTVGV